jgi:Fe-S oxidoreductase
MWLAYAVGNLEKHGHEVLFIDAPAQGTGLQEIKTQALSFAPHMAVFDTSTPSIYNDIKAAVELKSALAGLFVVLVGVHVSALPESTLQENEKIDAVAFGEYDATLVELAAKLPLLFDTRGLEAIDGIAFRDAEGKIVKNRPRAFIEDLDQIPLVSQVYRKHLDIRNYFYGHSRCPLVVIVTGRGCPFHCTYCVIPQMFQGHRYRKRSVENVVAEFRYIRDNFPGVKEIMLEDDTLTADKERCRAFAEALIAQGLTTVPWSANSRADVDLQTMRIMKKAGCRLFCVGFESGDQRILDNIKKGTRIETIKAFVKDAKRAGILIHGCFMVGNRGETRETLEKTLAFAKELNPDTSQFYPIMVYPGTSDYVYFKEKGWMVTEDFSRWLTKEGLHSSVVSNPELRYEELVAFCDRARREFLLRPTYLVSKLYQVIRHPGEALRILRAANTIWKYLLAPSLKVKGRES